MCSVIVPMHDTIGRYGGRMLSLVVSPIISDVEDRFVDMLKLLSHILMQKVYLCKK